MQIITPECHQARFDMQGQMAKQNAHQYNTLSQSQMQLSFEDQQFQSQEFEPSIYLKLFFSYLYFTQGLIIALPATLPYIYPDLPSYDVMAVFSASTLPFSFKFILAPFIEKFTLFKYGKKKFWIVISQILSSLCIFACTFLTDFSQSYKLAFLLFFAMMFITLQDISLDSLAKKQLRKAHITSMVSVTNQTTGIIVGSMFLLKFTSPEFSYHFGYTQPLLHSSTIILVLSLLIFIPSIFIHFFFHQTKLRKQIQSTKTSLTEIFCAYRAFFKWNSKYFRTIVYSLIVNQGLNFYFAGYDYELVQAGFSRDKNNTIQNIIAIPVNIIACIMTQKIEPFGIKRGLLVSICGQILICIYLRIVFPLDVYSIAITNFLLSVLSTWTYMIGIIFTYQFPMHRFTGMFITFLGSATNLGNSVAFHTKVLAWAGWWTMSWVGIGIQLIIVGLLYFFYIDWKDQSLIELDQILQNEASSQSHNQNENWEMGQKRNVQQ